MYEIVYGCIGDVDNAIRIQNCMKLGRPHFKSRSDVFYGLLSIFQSSQFVIINVVSNLVEYRNS